MKHPLTFVAGLLLVGTPLAMAQSGAARAQIVLPDRTKVRVEVAATEAERNRGLMHRTSLEKDHGMIFVFTKPDLHAFWMKNTLIPLDMLWLDASGKVVSLTADVPPCKEDPCPTYPPTTAASYVLEMVGGYAKAHGLKVGDTLKLEGVPATATP